jgi:hypothetical protein
MLEPRALIFSAPSSKQLFWVNLYLPSTWLIPAVKPVATELENGICSGTGRSPCRTSSSAPKRDENESYHADCKRLSHMDSSANVRGKSGHTTA